MAPFLESNPPSAEMSAPMSRSFEQTSIDTLRSLSIDAIHKAQSGHPGAPLGLAPLFHVLFQQMRLNPKTNKGWINRDRFVLSNGHACALLYSMLHLLGYPISIDDLKSFRQLNSITPGHPESHITPGVEITTGPLGQGFANAVGLAIAQAHIAARFNRPGYSIFSNHTYVVFGDGCAMEGVASEAASLAGHLKLNNLIAIYDDNKVCIDGSTESAFTEDVAKRFEAYGWRVICVPDGDHDLVAIANALVQARDEPSKPTMIKLTTTIGYGSLLQGQAACHGSPLKADDIKQFKQRFNIPQEPFSVGASVREFWSNVAAKGKKLEAEWSKMFKEYILHHNELYKELRRRLDNQLPSELLKHSIPSFKGSDPPLASRKLSQNVLDTISSILPELISGSADLTSSNLTRWTNATDFQDDSLHEIGNRQGRYLRWGVREHAMGAAMNGIAAYGVNLIPIGGTFLNFLPYAAGAIRLAALSGLRVIWIATHDSIALGEDGPTHQPIETLAYFRAMPSINVWRPADGNETSAAYRSALRARHTPSIIALTRQNLPQLHKSTIELAVRGGYVLINPGNADITLLSTGSEVQLCLQAAKVLGQKNIRARVVSFPCAEVFDAQPYEYRISVLEPDTPILSVEALSTYGWKKYSHAQFGIDTFGASGPCDELFKAFEMTTEGIVERAIKTVDFFKKFPIVGSPIDVPFEPVKLT